MVNSEAETRKLWRETFKEDFSQPGAMFRGEPPNGKLFQIPEEMHDQILLGNQYRLDILVEAHCSKIRTFSPILIFAPKSKI